MKIFYYYDKRGEKVNRPPGYCKLRGKHKIKQKKPPHASQRRAVLTYNTQNTQIGNAPRFSAQGGLSFDYGNFAFMETSARWLCKNQ
jgi:hypothetical protein